MLSATLCVKAIGSTLRLPQQLLDHGRELSVESSSPLPACLLACCRSSLLSLSHFLLSSVVVGPSVSCRCCCPPRCRPCVFFIYGQLVVLGTLSARFWGCARVFFCVLAKSATGVAMWSCFFSWGWENNERRDGNQKKRSGGRNP